ncbi:jg5274 [Pararge aegeria aegeria]|uniref:Jg5274 protein n=1 Tax=Pararge aegeria aegeria TaxID=348720 RepID=A0A8S4R7D2_9NEOP|nr:jg5274 [Pararge aegeria aegeria]
MAAYIDMRSISNKVVPAYVVYELRLIVIIFSLLFPIVWRLVTYGRVLLELQEFRALIAAKTTRLRRCKDAVWCLMQPRNRRNRIPSDLGDSKEKKVSRTFMSCLTTLSTVLNNETDSADRKV